MGGVDAGRTVWRVADNLRVVGVGSWSLSFPSDSSPQLPQENLDLGPIVPEVSMATMATRF